MKKQWILLVLLGVALATVSAYAYDPAGVSGSGNRLAGLAEQILRPIGGVVAVWKGYQAFANEHSREKNIAIAIGGAALLGWDKTLELLRWIIFGG